MKTLNILLLVLISIVSINAQSQNNDVLREKIEERKKEFIRTELQLTDEEEKAFWPLHDAYREEERILKEAYPKKDLSLMTDKEAEQLLSDMVDRERKMIDLKSKYIDKMSQVLNPRKVIKCFRLENDFKRSLLKRYKDRMSTMEHRSKDKNPGENKRFR